MDTHVPQYRHRIENVSDTPKASRGVEAGTRNMEWRNLTTDLRTPPPRSSRPKFPVSSLWSLDPMDPLSTPTRPPSPVRYNVGGSVSSTATHPIFLRNGSDLTSGTETSREGKTVFY